ncbi:concanavalin A-like lectin/glucanase [Cylindrobasidium torrendii FP15055 ss-10]|uniref:Concanavalin A-like lectin/glucanase n=1 Tax=Cylindrobasidium torrendii FP15055 ss-10 TaxID=1314674 RepID=A0A0D7ASU4_9AGAR|nr:concanavalin A-like lectin/glucanase [Cylindrobasidium torrendii FP15055 ss-10]
MRSPLWWIGAGALVLAASARKEDKLVSHVTDKGVQTFGDKTIERTVQLRTHSLYAPYIDQDLQNRWWDFGADAHINTNKHIRLTRDKPSQMGWLWSRLPLTSGNWVIEVEFKVSGESTNLFGDGLAMWISKTRAEPGPVFGSVNNWDGFGLFLDTYANSRHPYAFPRITGIINDGNTAYNFNTDGDKQGVGACSLNFRRTNVATKIKMTYIKDTILDVKIQYKGWDEWTDCFRWEGPNVHLPPSPFIGFSAMTGDVHDNHDIVAVSTYSAILSRDMDSGSVKTSSRGGGMKKKAGKSSWWWTILKFISFVAFVLVAYRAWLEYKRRGRAAFGGLGGMLDGAGSSKSRFGLGGGSSGGLGSSGGFGPTGGFGSSGGLGPTSGYGGYGGGPAPRAPSPYDRGAAMGSGMSLGGGGYSANKRM